MGGVLVRLGEGLSYYLEGEVRVGSVGGVGFY